MSDMIARYAEVVGPHTMDSLKIIADMLRGKRIVHVNSTKEGGGVAEILSSMVPLSRALGLDVSWEVIEGNPEFFSCTKTLHNSLQGMPGGLSEGQVEAYAETSRLNALRLGGTLEDADYVFIHDPQPAALLGLLPGRRGKWIWRCHIDVSSPNRSVWRFVKRHVEGYDASIFSLPDFAQPLPHTQCLITPSIDPLSNKNIPLPKEEAERVYGELGVPLDKPVVLQVSRFDMFKDPLGVIESFRIARKHVNLRLVLAGGGATDDPESGAVLDEVQRAAAQDPDIHVLVLPPDAHRTINALQTGAAVVMQKSTKEGFGLTVTEALWKKKPVIGGDVGGIRLQIINRFNGFRVRSPQGAAMRIRYLLAHRWKRERMGVNARQYVLENFLITGQLRRYLSLLIALDSPGGEWERWI